MTRLDIDVTAYAGKDIKSGLAFKYAADQAMPTSKYLDDAAGNITIPAQTTIAIVFHLRTSSVSWPDPDHPGMTTTYDLSFDPAVPLKIWDPLKPGTSPAPFGTPVLSSDSNTGKKDMVVTVNDTAGDDAHAYSYALAVSATGNGPATTITVDPRIRNGGNGQSIVHGPWGSILTFGAGIVAGLLMHAAWRHLRQDGP